MTSPLDGLLTTEQQQTLAAILGEALRPLSEVNEYRLFSPAVLKAIVRAGDQVKSGGGYGEIRIRMAAGRAVGVDVTISRKV